MKKAPKIILIVISVIIILVILGIVTLNILIKPANVKKMLIAQVKEKTGRQLHIKKLDYSFFPSASITIDGASLSNKKGFGAQPFLTLKHAKLGVKLSSLMNGQAKMDKITVSGFSLHLEKNKQGQSNWQDLTSKTSTKKHTPTKTNRQQPTKTNHNQLQINIPGINIQHVNITFNDRQTGQHIQLNDIHFQAPNLQTGKTSTFKTGIAFNNLQKHTSGKIGINGKITLPRDGHQYTLSKVHFSSMIKDNKGKHQLNITNIHAVIQINNALIIRPMSADLYQGHFKGAATINFNQVPAAYSLTGTINNLSAQALLKDLYSYKKFTGTGQLQFHLLTRGETKKELLQHINGNGRFTFKNGQYQGLDAAYIIRSAISLINKKTKPIDNQNMTKFGSLSGKFAVNNGEIKNNLMLVSPVLQLSAQGKTHLVSEKIKYKGTATAMRGSLDHPKPIQPSIPFTLTGNFKHQKLQPDVQALLQSTLKDQLQDQLQKKLKHFDLKGLFGH
jgi:uncharacterized protein involved in outer membrane biogenesis